jgi:hypothetical protein
MANQGKISGVAVIEGTRIIMPTEISSVDGNVSIPSVATIGTIQFANISVGTVEVGTVTVVMDVATIGTIISPVPLGPYLGTVGTIASGNISATVISPLDGGRVAVNVGTIENSPPVSIAGQPIMIVVQGGTIGTITSGAVSVVNTPTVLATVMGQPISVVSQGTIGTIMSGAVSVVNTPTVIEGRQFVQTNILGVEFAGSYSGLTVATLQAGPLQDLVVDIIYGTVVVGSVQTQVLGVEPQSGLISSTIISGEWYAGTLVVGQRLTAAGPLGAVIAVGVNAVGMIAGIYVTAEQSAGS